MLPAWDSYAQKKDTTPCNATAAEPSKNDRKTSPPTTNAPPAAEHSHHTTQDDLSPKTHNPALHPCHHGTVKTLDHRRRGQKISTQNFFLRAPEIGGKKIQSEEGLVRHSLHMHPPRNRARKRGGGVAQAEGPAAPFALRFDRLRFPPSPSPWVSGRSLAPSILRPLVVVVKVCGRLRAWGIACARFFDQVHDQRPCQRPEDPPCHECPHRACGGAAHGRTPRSIASVSTSHWQA